MSTTLSAIIDHVPSADGKPSTTYRYAGDRAILVEYGEMEFDLTLNFFVLAVDDALRDNAIGGVIETAPGFRSILVSFDPLAVSVPELLGWLRTLHEELLAEREIAIPSRIVHLPAAFDDSQTRAAVARYIHSIRRDAPNAEGGNNIDYVVRYNGFEDREQLYESVVASELWTAFIGFFPGLPFLFPLDPRHVVFSPKYNPTRTWTAEGTIGLGGPCFSIYPVESAGGYQLLGRTLPIYDLKGLNAIFRQDPLLLRAGDRVKFHHVEENELLALWEDVRADRYTYRIEDAPFDVGSYLEWLPSVAEEAEERRRRREEAAAVTPVP